jgi:hypothetical protein
VLYTYRVRTGRKGPIRGGNVGQHVRFRTSEAQANMILWYRASRAASLVEQDSKCTPFRQRRGERREGESRRKERLALPLIGRCRASANPYAAICRLLPPSAGCPFPPILPPSGSRLRSLNYKELNIFVFCPSSAIAEAPAHYSKVKFMSK